MCYIFFARVTEKRLFTTRCVCLLSADPLVKYNLKRSDWKFITRRRTHFHFLNGLDWTMNLPADAERRATVSSFIDFMSTRGKGKGRMLSTDDMQDLVGKPRLDLHDHDLYVMGRTVSNEPLWSILRINSNTTAENKIQGKLAVRFLHGYGREKAGSDELRVTFAEGIRRFTTADSVGFKHRSAFFLRGKFYRLMHVEHLCNINVMSSSNQLRFQSITSIKKAQSYSMQRAMKRGWAHMSRERCKEDQKKKILKMMIPYWTNSAEFYDTFMDDLTSACEQARMSLGHPDRGCLPVAVEGPKVEEVEAKGPSKKRAGNRGLVVW